MPKSHQQPALSGAPRRIMRTVLVPAWPSGFGLQTLNCRSSQAWAVSVPAEVGRCAQQVLRLPGAEGKLARSCSSGSTTLFRTEGWASFKRPGQVRGAGPCYCTCELDSRRSSTEGCIMPTSLSRSSLSMWASKSSPKPYWLRSACVPSGLSKPLMSRPPAASGALQTPSHSQWLHYQFQHSNEHGRSMLADGMGFMCGLLDCAVRRACMLCCRVQQTKAEPGRAVSYMAAMLRRQVRLAPRSTPYSRWGSTGIGKWQRARHLMGGLIGGQVHRGQGACSLHKQQPCHQLQVLCNSQLWWQGGSIVPASNPPLCRHGGPGPVQLLGRQDRC